MIGAAVQGASALQVTECAAGAIPARGFGLGFGALTSPRALLLALAGLAGLFAFGAGSGAEAGGVWGHLAYCLPGGATASSGASGAPVLFGHCAWCYASVGLAVAGLFAPGRRTR